MRDIIMRKILKIFTVLLVFVILNSALVYFFSVALENSPEAYPQKATLSEIFTGNSESLIVDDFEIKNWANESGNGLSATVLPNEILNHEFQKCNKWETTLICMLQNRFNSKLGFEKYTVESGTLFDSTDSVDYVRIFGIDYIVAMYTNSELFDENLSTVFVVYKSTKDIYSDLKEFETEKENFFKVFPFAIKFLPQNVTTALYIFGVTEIVVVLLVISKVLKKRS